MKCTKCVYCVQKKSKVYDVICSNKELIKGLGFDTKYEEISEPAYCKFYTSKSQYLAELHKNFKP